MSTSKQQEHTGDTERSGRMKQLTTALCGLFLLAGAAIFACSSDDSGSAASACDGDDQCPVGQVCEYNACINSTSGKKDSSEAEESGDPESEDDAAEEDEQPSEEELPEDETDEPCVEDDERDCFSGLPSEEGVGICKKGVQTCGSDETWGKCEGETSPEPEICDDGDDNDCDGDTDADDADCSGAGSGDGGVSPDAGVQPTADGGGPTTGVCSGKSGWTTVAQIDYSQGSPNNKWAQAQHQIHILTGDINGVRVSGHVEGAGYCFAYWGAGSVASQARLGSTGIYNIDNRAYRNTTGCDTQNTCQCPFSTPLFASWGERKACGWPDNKSTGIGTKTEKASLPAGVTLNLVGQHLIPTRGGYIRCKFEVDCK